MFDLHFPLLHDIQVWKKNSTNILEGDGVLWIFWKYENMHPWGESWRTKVVVDYVKLPLCWYWPIEKKAHWFCDFEIREWGNSAHLYWRLIKISSRAWLNDKNSLVTRIDHWIILICVAMSHRLQLMFLEAAGDGKEF